MDILIEYITVNEKEYKLQHPGNREVLKIRNEYTNHKNGKLNFEKIMDYCFEHVVIPSGHGFKPTIDNISPKEFEVWLQVLPRFLRHGDLGEWRDPSTGNEKSREAS